MKKFLSCRVREVCSSIHGIILKAEVVCLQWEWIPCDSSKEKWENRENFNIFVIFPPIFHVFLTPPRDFLFLLFSQVKLNFNLIYYIHTKSSAIKYETKPSLEATKNLDKRRKFPSNMNEPVLMGTPEEQKNWQLFNFLQSSSTTHHRT